jgi:hypothetical protein
MLGVLSEGDVTEGNFPFFSVLVKGSVKLSFGLGSCEKSFGRLL